MPSRIGDTYELQSVTVTCDAALRPTRKGMNKMIGYMELTQLLAGTYDQSAFTLVAPKAQLELFTYGMAYGPRIVGQMGEVVQLLRSDPTTRRAVVFVGGKADGLGSDQPCTSVIQFLRREGRTNAIVSMRSWDVVKGLPYDITMFGGITQAVAAMVGDDPGELSVTAGSAHIYLADLARPCRPTDKLIQYTLHVPTLDRWEDLAGWAQGFISPLDWVDGVPGYITEKVIDTTAGFGGITELTGGTE